MTRLVLASTSRYRRELLERLRLPFECVAPETDETPLPGEAAADLARRLAAAKAASVAVRYPDALVIGSDQVADLHGRALGKPGTHDAAALQLHASSGQTVVFHTAVCVLADGAVHAFEDRTEVKFRALADDEIERYLQSEQPFDCAGSFKCEGLGAALFERIRTDDPTALIGLPLIALASVLRRCGLRVP